MDMSIWLIFAIWIVMLMISLRGKDVLWTCVASIIGLLFGVDLMTTVGVSTLIGLVLIILNMVVLWKGIMSEAKKA